mgnify:CR=1 FL=1
MSIFKMLVDPISKALPGSGEVVLHDLDLLPNSIIAVSGTVTGRQAGDAPTNLLLEAVASQDFDNKVAYSTRLADGRRLRSSTTFLPDFDGNPIAALCINMDVSSWELILNTAADMLGEHAPETSPTELGPEVFPRDINELGTYLIDRAIANVGVPVDLMHKRHKISVVRELSEAGLFTLKSAVDTVAEALGTTRFTIYNYLNELAPAEDAKGNT